MTDVSLKKLPPPAWLMRTLLIAATTCVILGGQIMFWGWQQGSALVVGGVAIPTYFPGALLLVLGARNLWSWRQMKLAIAGAKADGMTQQSK